MTFRYDVHAVVSGEGSVTRVNTLSDVNFARIDKAFSDHSSNRLIIVSSVGQDEFAVIDLWTTETSHHFPYTLEGFVPDLLQLSNEPMTFSNIDQAIGWCVLNINAIPNIYSRT